SAYKKKNGYNRYFGLAGVPGNTLSDCNTLGVWPYRGPKDFLKPDSYQIVSAGADHSFGQGSPPTATVPWTPIVASNFYPEGPPGHDDQSNFYDLLLGSESK